MANPTTNFNWQMPTNTDLVKDLPADFEVFGQAVDTSLMDLKGGTTGQVLSKASNTDMDFTWVTSDDANAIQNAIVDAKGDLITATAADTPARLAVGNNGETLVADSSASTGLRWQADYSAGKNKIINGSFDVWQRGSTFTVTGTETGVYKADRWFVTANGSTTIRTISRESFTPGSAPVAGYEGQYFLRYAQTTTGNNTYNFLGQKIEDVRTFAGQTVTISFWAKADSSRTISTQLIQNFGSGGSANVNSATANHSVTTSWTRFTHTLTLASISGKTVGSSSFLELSINLGGGGTPTIDFWGVQIEAGNVATAFQTATGNLASELAACQRYYWRTTAGTAFGAVATAYSSGTTTAVVFAQHPVKMRTSPSSVDFANVQIAIPGASGAVTALTLSQYNEQISTLAATSSGLTANLPAQLRGDNNVAGYLGINAEL